MKPINFEYTSQSGVAVHMKSAGGGPTSITNIAEVEGAMTITFERENGVVFVARDCTITSIEDMLSLAHKVETLHKRNEWRLEHVIITELVAVKSATILISGCAGASIDFRLGSKIGQGLLSLTDASISSQTGAFSGIGVNLIGAKGLTPLFKASALKRRFFGGSDFKPRALGGEGDNIKIEDSLSFLEVDYSDLGSDNSE